MTMNMTYQRLSQISVSATLLASLAVKELALSAVLSTFRLKAWNLPTGGAGPPEL